MRDEDALQMLLEEAKDQELPDAPPGILVQNTYLLRRVADRLGVDTNAPQWAEELKGRVERAEDAHQPPAKAEPPAMPKSPGRPLKNQNQPTLGGVDLYHYINGQYAALIHNLEQEVQQGNKEGARRLRDSILGLVHDESLRRVDDKYAENRASIRGVAERRLAKDFEAMGLDKLLRKRPQDASDDDPMEPPKTQTQPTPPQEPRKPAAKKPGWVGSAAGWLRRKRDAQVRAPAAKAKRKRFQGWDDPRTGLAARAGRRAGPLGAFVALLRLLNRQARLLGVTTIVLGLVAVPIGVFKFSAWSVAALLMVIVSGVYFVALNVLKLVASTLVGGINFVFAAVGGFLVQSAEQLLQLFGQGERLPCEFANGLVRSNFCSGREILAEGLIPASELNALSIPLLDPRSIMPQMSPEPVLSWVLRAVNAGEWKLGDAVGRTVGRGLERLVASSNVYVVMTVFVVLTAGVAFAAWRFWVRPALEDAGVRHA